MFRVEMKANQIASLAACMMGLLFDPEDEGRTFLRNVAKLLLDYTASLPRRRYSFLPPLWEPQTSHNYFMSPLEVCNDEQRYFIGQMYCVKKWVLFGGGQIPKSIYTMWCLDLVLNPWPLAARRHFDWWFIDSSSTVSPPPHHCMASAPHL
jgi:hypothetical protein